MKKIFKILGITLGSLTILSLIGLMFCFSFVDNYEGAYMFDSMTGETKALVVKDAEGKPIVNEDGEVSLKQGYIFHLPVVQSVHTIDLRPIQLCIKASSGSFDRVMNCKLVSFDFNGYRKFISWHGRQDYNTTTLERILMAYAYDEYEKSDYTFMKIHKDPNADTDKTTVNTKVKANEIDENVSTKIEEDVK